MIHKICELSLPRSELGESGRLGGSELPEGGEVRMIDDL